MLALRPEAEAEARRLATRPPGALLGGAAADAPDLQPVEAGRRVVAQAAGEPAVDDRRHPLDGHRGLGDVRRQHHLPAAERAQGGVLPLGREVAVERHDGEAAALGERGEGGRGALDLADAGKEDQDVAGVSERLLDGVAHRRGERSGAAAEPVARTGSGALAIADLDGEEPAAALDDRAARRAAAEEGGERTRLEGGRHGEEPEVRPHLALHLADHGEGEVGGEAPFVELVEEDGADAVEQRVGLQSLEEDPLGDDEQAGRGARPALEAHLIAHLLAQPPAALLGDPPRRRPRRDPPRLEHDDLTGPAHAGVGEGRRHPRRLAGARRRHEHGGRPTAKGGDELGQDGVDRQRLQGISGGCARRRRAAAIMPLAALADACQPLTAPGEFREDDKPHPGMIAGGMFAFGEISC